jgi:hypothetical protein
MCVLWYRKCCSWFHQAGRAGFVCLAIHAVCPYACDLSCCVQEQGVGNVLVVHIIAAITLLCSTPAQELVRSLLPRRSDGMRYSVLAVLRNNTLRSLLYLSGEPVHGRVSGWDGCEAHGMGWGGLAACRVELDELCSIVRRRCA